MEDLVGFNLVLPSFTEFYWVLLGFLKFSKVDYTLYIEYIYIYLYWLLTSFTGFYSVLPGFT